MERDQWSSDIEHIPNELDVWKINYHAKCGELENKIAGVMAQLSNRANSASSAIMTANDTMTVDHATSESAWISLMMYFLFCL